MKGMLLTPWFGADILFLFKFLAFILNFLIKIIIKILCAIFLRKEVE